MCEQKKHTWITFTLHNFILYRTHFCIYVALLKSVQYVLHIESCANLNNVSFSLLCFFQTLNFKLIDTVNCFWLWLKNEHYAPGVQSLPASACKPLSLLKRWLWGTNWNSLKILFWKSCLAAVVTFIFIVWERTVCSLHFTINIPFRSTWGWVNDVRISFFDELSLNFTC